MSYGLKRTDERTFGQARLGRVAEEPRGEDVSDDGVSAGGGGGSIEDDGASGLAVTTGIQEEIAQRRPFHSPKAELAVSILRTAALIERHFGQVVASAGVTVQQYNVLRILRGAGAEGLPTLVIRDRMIHEAPGITRLIDKLEKAGLARRERSSPDRRQVLCYITNDGLAVLDKLDVAMKEADEVAVGALTDPEQRQLLKLLERARAKP